MNYEFTLRFRLPIIEEMDEYDERLFSAEETSEDFFGIDEFGLMEIEVERTDTTASRALNSAIREILHVLPEAKFIEALPDIVNMSDIASLTNVSRQAVRKMYNKNLDTFPAPLHAGATLLWNLAHVLHWLESRNDEKYNYNLHLTAAAAMQVNLSHQRKVAGALWEATNAFVGNPALTWTPTRVASPINNAANYEPVSGARSVGEYTQLSAV